VQAIGQQPRRAPDGSPVHYECHRPEQTTLYRLVQQHASSFIAHTEASIGAELPRPIKDEFDAFLECCILAHGVPRLRAMAVPQAPNESTGAAPHATCDANRAHHGSVQPRWQAGWPTSAPERRTPRQRSTYRKPAEP